MIKLLEKDAKFILSPKCKEAFLTLKKLLTTTPILAQSDIGQSINKFIFGLHWLVLYIYSQAGCFSSPKLITCLKENSHYFDDDNCLHGFPQQQASLR
jgi:hypothetical protein